MDDQDTPSGDPTLFPPVPEGRVEWRDDGFRYWYRDLGARDVAGTVLEVVAASVSVGGMFLVSDVEPLGSLVSAALAGLGVGVVRWLDRRRYVAIEEGEVRVRALGRRRRAPVDQLVKLEKEEDAIRFVFRTRDDWLMRTESEAQRDWIFEALEQRWRQGD